ncbi:metal-sulfur cluster assembly factor [Thermogladius sp. 4427co]|uniref:metal-sulfur cluster assembly factor n=1 Tax=Thermogladius sp. 4427co TaxID=3450718 RepID=UPI003F790160
MSNVEELKKKIIEILETIADPEIGIDVYNLGMIYGIDIEGNTVKIKMTLTTPFCPLASMIPLMIEEEIKKNLNMDVAIEIVYDPPWNPTMMTEKGRRMFIERFGYDIVEEYRRQQESERFEY